MKFYKIYDNKNGGTNPFIQIWLLELRVLRLTLTSTSVSFLVPSIILSLTPWMTRGV